MMGRIVTRNM